MINNVKLEMSAGNKNQFPSNNLPQIAFVGKSNVGKSSLINSMIYRKSLAHTSNSPGKTRTINFYNVENELYFVDLPGYGYARASKTQIQKWSRLIESYLSGKNNLRLILLLIDIRHVPSENDKMMYDWLIFHNFNTIIVATKADKIKSSAIELHIENIKNKLCSDKIILPFSSKTNFNRDELWKIIKNSILPI
jgi:ribosome biogenesis GTP-binding protein YsxC/EngB